MKLDFNFQIKDHEGKEIGKANETMAVILENGSQTDERYLDKVESWSKLLRKGGQVDIDATDMKELKKMVMDSRFIFNMAKYQLKEYIQKRIDLAEVKSDKKEDK